MQTAAQYINYCSDMLHSSQWGERKKEKRKKKKERKKGSTMVWLFITSIIQL